MSPRKLHQAEAKICQDLYTSRPFIRQLGEHPDDASVYYYYHCYHFLLLYNINIAKRYKKVNNALSLMNVNQW